MALTKRVNGDQVEMSVQEETAFNASRKLNIDQAKERKLIDLDEKAEAVRTGGVEVPGGKIKTTDGALARLLGTDIKSPASRNVKIGNGKFQEMSPSDLQAIKSVVHDFIQACYDHEKTLAQAINSAVDEGELNAIDIDAGWPV